MTSSPEVVVVDATALWVKLRGGERVSISKDEKLGVEARKRISRSFKETNKNVSQAVAECEREVEEFFGDYENRQEQVQAAYSSAGDKYRLTLINFSSVRKWLKPTDVPTSYKGKSILLVPCTESPTSTSRPRRGTRTSSTPRVKTRCANSGRARRSVS